MKFGDYTRKARSAIAKAETASKRGNCQTAWREFGRANQHFGSAAQRAARDKRRWASLRKLDKRIRKVGGRVNRCRR